MSEWEKIRLGDLLEEYCERNINQKYKAVAVGKYGIRKREEIYSKELSKDLSNNKIIKQNTLTIGMGSNQIDIGILLEDEKFCVSPAYSTYKIKNCNSKFLKYYLEYFNPKLSDLFMIISARQGKSVDKEGLLNYLLDIPSIAEQENLSKIFGNIDKIINNIEKNIMYYSLLKKEYIKKMFYANKWDEKHLNEVVNIFGGYAFSSNKLSKERKKYQIVKMGNVYKNVLQLDRSPSYIEEISLKENKYLLKEGDIIITLTGTVGKRDYGYSCMINKEENLLLNQRLALLRVKENNDPYFINLLIKEPEFLEQFFNSSSGGTGKQTNVSTRIIEKFNIKIPSYEIQIKYSAFLKRIDKKIELLTIKKNEYNQMKKGLMQKLLTGKVKI